MNFHSVFHKHPKFPDYLNYTLEELTTNQYLFTEITTPRYTGPKEFPTLEEAVSSIRQWGMQHDIIIRKGSGNNKLTKSGEKKKVILVCQCNGKQTKTQTTSRKSKIVKTECPFRINLNFREDKNIWVITKMMLTHNHPLHYIYKPFAEMERIMTSSQHPIVDSNFNDKQYKVVSSELKDMILRERLLGITNEVRSDEKGPKLPFPQKPEKY